MSVSLRENETIRDASLPLELAYLRADILPHQPSQARKSKRFFDTHFDQSYGVHWLSLRADCPTRMTQELVCALRQEQMDIEQRVRREITKHEEKQIHYQVLSSAVPGVFNLGGDLEFISQMVKNGDRGALVDFGRMCIDLVYKNATSYQSPVTTISLVQGTALGGGFEAALSANVLVAERQSKMGLPEVMFNMFPGMGAYQLLAQRLAPVQAQRLIQSGRIYSAEELYEIGIIDILTNPGDGEQGVWDYIRRHRKQANAEWGLRRTMQISSPIHYDELLESIEVWADTALSLNETDLKHMDFLMRAQKNRGV